MRAYWKVLVGLGSIIVGLSTVIGGLWAGIQMLEHRQQGSGAAPSQEEPREELTGEVGGELDGPVEERGEAKGPTPSHPLHPTTPQTGIAAADIVSLVNPGVVPITEAPTLALAFEGDAADVERLEAKLAQVLSSPSLRLVSGLFKPAFKARGLLRVAYDGDTAILARSGALAAVDRVLLGRVERSCGRSSELAADLVSCTVHLHYKTIGRSGAIVSSGSVSVIGAGFSDEAARDRALEMLVELHGERLVTFN